MDTRYVKRNTLQLNKAEKDYIHVNDSEHSYNMIIFYSVVYICKPDAIYVVKAILFKPSPLKVPGVSNISSSVPLE